MHNPIFRKLTFGNFDWVFFRYRLVSNRTLLDGRTVGSADLRILSTYVDLA